MQYVYHEPAQYGFKDRDGHDGKFFGTESDHTQHLIIETNDKLTVRLTQTQCEFDYYIIEAHDGYFELNGDRQVVEAGDLVVVPPGTKYTFGGKLKMLLINTPKWTAEQEISEPL